MKNLILIAAIALTGCSSMPPKVCDASYGFGGYDYNVSIFGVRKMGNKTFLRAGYPFSFQWVDSDHFNSHTCKKAP